MAKHQDFQGVLYDILDEIVVDRAPAIRGTYAEAMEDAKQMVDAFNAMAEDDDSRRVDDSYCFVLIDGLIAYSEAEAA